MILVKRSPALVPNWRSLFINLNKKFSGSQKIVHCDYGIRFHLQECASLLQHSSSLRDLNRGKALHSTFIKIGFDQDVFILNNIMRMYSACGNLIDAGQVFDEMPEPNLVSWTSMISSFIQHGYVDIGLQLFSLMHNSGLLPNEFGLSPALKACRIMGEFKMGKLLHGCIIKCGFELYVFCSTAVLDMYVKSGNMNDARMFFEGIPSKCEAFWNAMIDGYVRNSNSDEAMELFHRMVVFNKSPSCFTYTILIKLWANVLNFDMGRIFHGRIIKAGFENYSFVGGTLVDMYVKWGDLDDASNVFWGLEEIDEVVWSTMLAGFHQSGDTEQGLNLFLEFFSEGYKLDPFTYASIINLCSDSENLGLGFQVHSCFVKSGFVLDSFVGSSLVEMYVSFGMIDVSYMCFLDVRNKNEIIFNAMIHGFVFDSDNRSAIEMFSEMRKLGLMPNCSTLIYIFRAYTNLDMLEEGKILHGHIVKTLGESNLSTENALVEMYARFGRVDEAIMVFEEMGIRNEFSWTTMIFGYVESERHEEALELFHYMHSLTVMKPSQFTLVTVLQACSRLPALVRGKQAHGYIIKSGFQSNVFVGSALIGMYAKSSGISDASRVFSNMYEQDVVSWSAMIAAYSQHGLGDEALKLFSEFEFGSLAIDESILSSCLSACSSLVALEKGKFVHARIIKTGFESHLQIGCAIIDMYSECGSIGDARMFFNKMREHNVVSWTAMVCGYAQHGLGKEALKLFDEMKVSGVDPDGVTFVGVLSACSHVGLVEEGQHYFESMRNDYGLDITINHYACMVDLLGRAGHINEAGALINMVPFQSKALLWRTLLGACSKHGNIEVGNRIAKLLVKLEPNEPSTYVLLANIYASVSMWDHSIDVRNKMMDEGLNKDRGRSWIEVHLEY